MTQLTHYLILLAFLAGAVGFAVCVWAASRAFGKTIEEPGKATPAQSGHLDTKPAWGRYHVRYYGFALLFLAFDMEMAYMYPWAVVYRELGLMALLDMGVFLAILFLGLLYTWSQGGLRRQ